MLEGNVSKIMFTWRQSVVQSVERTKFSPVLDWKISALPKKIYVIIAIDMAI